MDILKNDWLELNDVLMNIEDLERLIKEANKLKLTNFNRILWELNLIKIKLDNQLTTSNMIRD